MAEIALDVQCTSSPALLCTSSTRSPEYHQSVVFQSFSWQHTFCLRYVVDICVIVKIGCVPSPQQSQTKEQIFILIIGRTHWVVKTCVNGKQLQRVSAITLIPGQEIGPEGAKVILSKASTAVATVIQQSGLLRQLSARALAWIEIAWGTRKAPRHSVKILWRLKIGDHRAKAIKEDCLG